MIITIGFGQRHTTSLDSTPPTFAGLQSATDLEKGRAVRLQWLGAVDDESGLGGYSVYCSTKPTNVWTEGVKWKAEPGGSDVTITGLQNNRSYYFGVRAFDRSDPPNEDSNIIVKSATPTKPKVVILPSPCKGATCL